MNLIEQYQYFYSKSKIFSVIQEILSEECHKDKMDYQDLLNQFFIKSARIRRQNILNALQNRDTVTVKTIQSLAEGYSGGVCEVTEQNEEYKFTIKFVGVRGEPESLPSLKEALERMKPAHLTYELIFTYMTWEECTRYHKTWDKWEELNLTWHEFERYWQGYMAEFLEWQMFDNYKNSWKDWDDMWIKFDDLEIYV